jgi:hypothetical protein
MPHRFARFRRRSQATRVTLAVIVAVAFSTTASVQGSASSFSHIDRSDLCVTNGAVSTEANGELAINTPSSRAVLRFWSEPAAEIRFRYLGRTEASKPLASGELRRQIGLKLRAEDTCNLLYVMWHIEPDSRIAVSVKRNPGQHSHAQCDAHGYTNIRSGRGAAVPAIRAGESHTLRAELHGTDLLVVADGLEVWEGSVGDTVKEFDGPLGFRTDNARFVLDYFARSVRKGEQISGPCKPSPGD